MENFFGGAANNTRGGQLLQVLLARRVGASVVPTKRLE
jgi:hypothetical protein